MNRKVVRFRWCTGWGCCYYLVSSSEGNLTLSFPFPHLEKTYYLDLMVSFNDNDKTIYRYVSKKNYFLRSRNNFILNVSHFKWKIFHIDVLMVSLVLYLVKVVRVLKGVRGNEIQDRGQGSETVSN